MACSHLGRPDGTPDPQYSMAPVAARLTALLGHPVPITPIDLGLVAPGGRDAGVGQVPAAGEAAAHGGPLSGP